MREFRISIILIVILLLILFFSISNNPNFLEDFENIVSTFFKSCFDFIGNLFDSLFEKMGI